jgi:AraC-like DNA-binding protein
LKLELRLLGCADLGRTIRFGGLVRSSPSRRVDWDVILDAQMPAPKIVDTRGPVPQLAKLLSAVASPSPGAVDQVLRDAVELARAVIQLERAAIFVVDENRHAMVGTWGTDDQGRTVDEHHLMYAFGAGDQAVFDRARNGLPWAVFDDCPLVSQVQDETRVVGKSWVACTAIHGAHGPLAILFNDTALTGAPPDEGKQARAAILCSLLGQALDRCRRYLTPRRNARTISRHPDVRRVTELLAGDSTLTCDELAERVNLSAGRLARIFKRETHTSLVDHRNNLRLARFFDRVNTRGGNLLEAALEAGFGSYAQFHRVFRARFGQAPRTYLAKRK